MSDFIGTKLTMNLGERSYDIILKNGALENLYQFARLDRKVAVVTDSGVPAQYAQRVADQCRDAVIITVPQGEASKSFKILETVLKQMLDFHMGRGDLVVAVGGGVVGDLAGFAASIYMRGIDFINCPTTTLSMIDSSIGGKTAVDLGDTKNIVGAFWQPKLVIVDPDTLATLPRFRDFLIAEGVKRWRIFTIFPVGRGADDPSLQLDTEQFRRLMEFIRDTRREGRIAVNYGCEGFLGRYEGDVRDTFYHCSAGVSIAGIRVDGAISGCTSIRARYDQGNIYRDNFMDVWNNRFAPYRDREWMRHGACGNCRVFKYCRGNGMHLRDETGQLLVCHYKKLL